MNIDYARNVEAKTRKSVLWFLISLLFPASTWCLSGSSGLTIRLCSHQWQWNQIIRALCVQALVRLRLSPQTKSSTQFIIFNEKKETKERISVELRYARRHDGHQRPFHRRLLKICWIHPLNYSSPFRWECFELAQSSFAWKMKSFDRFLLFWVSFR